MALCIWQDMTHIYFTGESDTSIQDLTPSETMRNVALVFPARFHLAATATTQREGRVIH